MANKNYSAYRPSTYNYDTIMEDLRVTNCIIDEFGFNDKYASAKQLNKSPQKAYSPLILNPNNALNPLPMNSIKYILTTFYSLSVWKLLIICRWPLYQQHSTCGPRS